MQFIAPSNYHIPRRMLKYLYNEALVFERSKTNFRNFNITLYDYDYDYDMAINTAHPGYGLSCCHGSLFANTVERV